MAVEFDEMEFEGLLLLGSIFLRTGKYERAVQVLEGLEEARPQDGHVLKSLAFACIRLKRYGQALPRIEHFLRATGLSPEERLWGTFLKIHALWGLDRKAEWTRAIDDFAELRAAAAT